MKMQPNAGVRILWISRRPVSKGFRVSRHAHSWWQYLFVESGQMFTMVGGNYRHLSKGQAIVIPGNEIHSFLATADAQIVELKFTVENERLHQLLEKNQPISGDITREIADTVDALVDEGLKRELFYQEMAALLLHRLLLLHVRQLTHSKDPENAASSSMELNHVKKQLEEEFKNDPIGSNVATIVQYMDNHMEKPLTLNTLAQHFGYTRSYLCQMFASSIGISPIRYLTLLRLSRAQELLASSSFSLQHISSMCGFRSSHQMWRVFRAEVGCSPTEFRQRYADTQAAAINFTGLREGLWTQII